MVAIVHLAWHDLDSNFNKLWPTPLIYYSGSGSEIQLISVCNSNVMLI